MTPVLREQETVTPLELFFDLVFVLGLTQCTALMAAQPTWEGVAKGMLVLGVLWWCWVGYTWVTSVVDPEEDAVRLVIFAAMAALLVVGLCVPQAFGDSALIFACAYAFVRIAHIALFLFASRDDPPFRKSVVGLAISSAIGVSLLVAASFADGALQGGLWALALALDMGGPYVFGSDGWRLVPQHFSERHGLIVIIALGESIVAVGVGAEAGVDSYSYLHFPMVAGIVLIALGMKKTLGHTEDPLKLVPAAALLGGSALYLLAHVAFRLRNIGTLNTRRLVLSVLLVAFLPAAVEIPALATVCVLAAALTILIALERHSYGERRNRLRQELRSEAAH